MNERGNICIDTVAVCTEECPEVVKWVEIAYFLLEKVGLHALGQFIGRKTIAK